MLLKRHKPDGWKRVLITLNQAQFISFLHFHRLRK